MVGDLYLGCGRPSDEAGLWQKMLHRPVTRIIYWPFALPSTLTREAEAWLQGHLDALDVNYRLDVWPDLHHHRAEELTIARADLLFVGGGNTFRLLDAVQRSQFGVAVRDFVNSGGDYYGGSAGAVLACESITIADGHDPNEVGLTDLTGLGLVAGIHVLPHFTDDQLGQARDWSHAHQGMVLGLPETAGLYCHGETAEIIGAGTVVTITARQVGEHTPGDQLCLPR